jgi:alpha-glucoside transport system substrate-binding protein
MGEIMTKRASRTRVALFASVAAGSLLLAACGGGDDDESSGSSPTAVSAECQPFSAYMGHSGTTVSLFTSVIAPESDKYIASYKKFEDCTGIKIAYEGSNDFESQLTVRVQGGTAPDLAWIPQPGLLQRMVQTGQVKKPPKEVEDNVDKNWAKGWKDYGSVDGVFYGAPNSSNVKSLVWYSPKQFAAKGYKVPTTWDEMMALSDQIAASGQKPWCGGIGSGTATGWPATDWLEELVMRESGPDVYDKWITHDVKFDSPEIKKSMATLEKWMKNPKYVNAGIGDVKSIATTTFQDAGHGIPDGKCFMLQQASFYANQFAEGTVIAEDGDAFAFYLPPIGDQFGKPLEVAAEFTTAFADRPEVQAVQTYITTTDWINEKIKLNDWVSANKAADKSLYKNPIDKLSADLLTDPSATARFDASDLMPAAVGSGSMWKEFTAWFGENKSTDAVLKALDASWPS